MKYFYDIEFVEGTQKRRVGNLELPKMFDTKQTIDLISIGIVDEDGREYYAISKDFNLKEAWNRYDIEKEWYSIDESNQSTRDIKVYWIRENVLKPIFAELLYSGHVKAGLPLPKIEEGRFTYKNFKKLIKAFGKTNKQISKEIYDFVNPDLGYHVASYNNSELKKGGVLYEHFEKHNVESDGIHYYAQPKFYSYYGAYDHVVFCWLFGKMIDLPKGFPMYSIDLKQKLDQKLENIVLPLRGFSQSPNESLESKLDEIKNYPEYPKNLKEHDALYDALWLKELHNFIEKL